MDRRLLEAALVPLLPPAAVFLAERGNQQVAITAALCLLFWLPGAIYAQRLLSR